MPIGAWLDKAMIARRSDGALDPLRQPTSEFAAATEVACRAWLKKLPYLQEAGDNVITYRLHLLVAPNYPSPRPGDRIESVTKNGTAMIEAPLTVRSVQPVRSGNLLTAEWRGGDAGSG